MSNQISCEILNTAKAAAVLGLKPPTLRKAVSTRTGLASDLPYVRLGRKVLYRRVDLLAWLEKHLVRPEGC